MIIHGCAYEWALQLSDLAHRMESCICWHHHPPLLTLEVGSNIFFFFFNTKNPPFLALLWRTEEYACFNSKEVRLFWTPLYFWNKELHRRIFQERTRHSFALLYEQNLQFRKILNIKTNAKRYSLLLICILNVRLGLHMLVWKYIYCSPFSRKKYILF